MKFSAAVDVSRYWKAYLLSRYRHFSEQERLAINILGLVSCLAIFYWGIWQPLASAAESAQQAYSDEAELLNWIKANESKFKRVSDSSNDSLGINKGRSILSLVTDSAQKSQIALTRFEPANNQGLHVWFDNVPFNQLISWLYELDNQGVILNNVQLERQSEDGYVSAVITLK